MKQITVLIADDHALFREGLHMLLEREEDLQVVGEARDSPQPKIADLVNGASATGKTVLS